MIQHAVGSRFFGEELDVLVVVDLDEGDPDFVAVFAFEVEAFLIAQEINPEGARFGEIGNIECDVGDPQNLGTGGRVGAGKQEWDEAKESGEFLHERDSICRLS